MTPVIDICVCSKYHLTKMRFRECTVNISTCVDVNAGNSMIERACVTFCDKCKYSVKVNCLFFFSFPLLSQIHMNR